MSFPGKIIIELYTLIVTLEKKFTVDKRYPIKKTNSIHYYLLFHTGIVSNTCLQVSRCL